MIEFKLESVAPRLAKAHKAVKAERREKVQAILQEVTNSSHLPEMQLASWHTTHTLEDRQLILNITYIGYL